MDSKYLEDLATLHRTLATEPDTQAALTVPKSAVEVSVVLGEGEAGLSRVLAGQTTVCMLGSWSYTIAECPEDGYLIRWGPVTIYLRDSDLVRARESGSDIIARSWDHPPTKK